MRRLGVAPALVDQRAFRGIDRRILLRPVTEPRCESYAPHDAEPAEQEEGIAPRHARYFRDEPPDERRQATHQPARHPDGPLRKRALVIREPVVQRARDVWISTGLPHAKQ